MSEQQYEYFAEVPQGWTPERPDGLWRRRGDDWEYLSLLDWEWHDVKDTAVRYAPVPDVLHPVPAERAAQLRADRQGWVTYWAYWSSERRWREGKAPTTVCRRRRSPERIYDETFMRSNEWRPDTAVSEFFDARTSNPPHLEEISADRAEELLMELRGIVGATEL
ncbi:hypothetical protein GCM10010218_26860 [Streptomyces mashuensis]|uniref:Uncharacterized protein n=1 Tax=Streptomyces mashuensis TaxID=33904 RepID=A0A919B405_9ACTN|nr:hypothetical protein [Streptomyces mashuensis]GHF44172.1 hypothetical protein GCM10010218_26860 [Streptomyces mashuensis]